MAILNLIGRSPKFRTVLDEINIVAPVDSAVLVQGETGTGKEVVAQAIHEASPRRNNRFVALNCAAIPAALLESELFGHERGAFTGAVVQRLGRFQAADRGTLFLDEIGDLPLELQPKLLRAIQEQEFERLGSSHTTRVDVRIVAATNQDLKRMVRENKFRADLFYRLNVFPIDLPPLRDRKEDIPLLLQHFVQHFASRYGKCVDCIPAKIIDAAMNYGWPGNIRELQNLSERAVIRTRNSELDVPIEELAENASAVAGLHTLVEANRAHILATLRQAKGVVGGRNGAAARLGMPRTTLISTMRRLGISLDRTEEGPLPSCSHAGTA